MTKKSHKKTNRQHNPSLFSSLLFSPIRRLFIPFLLFLLPFHLPLILFLSLLPFLPFHLSTARFVVLFFYGLFSFLFNNFISFFVARSIAALEIVVLIFPSLFPCLSCCLVPPLGQKQRPITSVDQSEGNSMSQRRTGDVKVQLIVYQADNPIQCQRQLHLLAFPLPASQLWASLYV